MGLRHRLTTSLLAIALASSVVGCKRKTEVVPPPPPPPDHLAPNELPIGQDKAFALPLPLSSKVVQRYGGQFIVTSSHSPEQLANFIRNHVSGGRVVSGTDATQFVAVSVKEEPARKLDITVHPAKMIVGNQRTEILVKDVTPVPTDPNLSNEEKWRRAGYRPDGRVLDPKTLQ
jgi:hypothetical protein